MVTSLRNLLFSLVCISTLALGAPLIDLTKQVEQSECSICMENPVNVELKCSHCFCEACITGWQHGDDAENRGGCPTCRRQIVHKEPSNCVFCTEPITLGPDLIELPCTTKGHRAHRECLVRQHPTGQGSCNTCKSSFELRTHNAPVEPQIEVKQNQAQHQPTKPKQAVDQKPSVQKTAAHDQPHLKPTSGNEYWRNFSRGGLIGMLVSFNLLKNTGSRQQTLPGLMLAALLMPYNNKRLAGLFSAGLCTGGIFGALLSRYTYLS